MSAVPIGKRTWAFAAGFVPAHGTGPEPAFTSRDQFGILNAGDVLANLRLEVIYADRDPVPGCTRPPRPRRTCFQFDTNPAAPICYTYISQRDIYSHRMALPVLRRPGANNGNAQPSSFIQ